MGGWRREVRGEGSAHTEELPGQCWLAELGFVVQDTQLFRKDLHQSASLLGRAPGQGLPAPPRPQPSTGAQPFALYQAVLVLGPGHCPHRGTEANSLLPLSPEPGSLENLGCCWGFRVPIWEAGWQEAPKTKERSPSFPDSPRPHRVLEARRPHAHTGRNPTQRQQSPGCPRVQNQCKGT